MEKVPLLIVIPYYSGDRAQALELCKVISGLQPHPVGNLAHILLVSRRDCGIDGTMSKILSPKFKVFQKLSNSVSKGWPRGPNGMFAYAMIQIAVYKMQYECVFWMEPDCTPIKRNWFWELVLEWRKRGPGVNVVGCMGDCNGNGTGIHITGCALYDPNIAKIIPEITNCQMAWDYEHRDKIVAMGKHTDLIKNPYKALNAPESLLDDPVSVVYHGYKDSSLTDLVKKRFNIN